MFIATLKQCQTPDDYIISEVEFDSAENGAANN